jgi:hypothetical protein
LMPSLTLQFLRYPDRQRRTVMRGTDLDLEFQRLLDPCRAARFRPRQRRFRESEA